MGPARVAATALVGFGSGVLSGMFGIGGGIVTTPAIRLLLGYPEIVAVATPLPVIVPSALIGAYGYAKRGLADVRSGAVIGLTGAPFAIGGAWLTRLLGGQAVLALTGALIVYAAASMLRTPRTPAPTVTPPVGSGVPDRGPAPPVARLALLGAAAGVYSGLLGLGGGFVIVPALVGAAFRFPVKRALGTSLVAVSILAVPGSLTHLALGHIDVALALTLAVGVVPGAHLGARVTAVAEERFVRGAFAALLALVGVLLAVETLGVL